MKSININELQSNISKIVKLVEKGDDYEVIRYSKPVAVVLSSKKYDKLLQELIELKGSCRHCVEEFKKTKLQNIKKI
ncbi:MAG TPA: type II toxin-antitoxin system Phd/YefM family antitoxin [Patescibacteria group bacterium]|nr:type II toxin-antitoxin system Phd/YefM family antitoxin [Patescibacteria group bacterium]